MCLVFNFFSNIAIYSMNIKGTQVADTLRYKNFLHVLLMLLLQASAEYSVFLLKWGTWGSNDVQVEHIKWGTDSQEQLWSSCIINEN